MRRLIARLRHEDRGNVAVVVALAMVPLLGFVAITIDAGALYSEKAQLQNGADAAALAVAQSCAAAAGCTTASATAIARSLANANAADGTAFVATPAFPTTRSVRITTSARDGATTAGSLALTFAPAIGIDTAAVTATATAGWGSPASGPAVLPLAFAPCVFDRFGTSGTIQVIQTHGSNDGTVSCSSRSPSGQLLPGGFGWLADPTGQCRTDVGAAMSAPIRSDTGNSVPSGCDAVLTARKNTTVVLPVYSDVTGSGSGGRYTIKGWAAFELLGWRFPGSSFANNTYAGAKCTGNCSGLIGRFVRFVSLDQTFTTGGADLGTAIVTLTR